jgi:hypothetical protein
MDTASEALRLWTNGNEWWAARDREHLAEMYRKATGLDLTTEDAIGDLGGWEECATDRTICVAVNQEGRVAEEGESCEVARLLPHELIARNGEGYVCGTDF